MVQQHPWDDEPFLHLSNKSIRYGRQGTGGIIAMATGLAGQLVHAAATAIEDVTHQQAGLNL